MADKFIGRKKELSVLKKKYDKKGFSMAVIYGRRRIGKTKLINKFVHEQDCKCISFTAVERSEAELLSMFTEVVLGELAPEMLGVINFTDFDKLFEFVGNYARKEKIILFIDEYPYFAKQCPYIQSLLQKVIDTQWKNTNLFFIICGSLVAFMKDEVLAESAPLHGRSDLELKLTPFNYLEAAEFFEDYSYEEKAIGYGLTNGVAKYLEQFDPKLSLEENIIDQFYSIGGYFSEEQIKTVLTGERQNPALYSSVISAVATGHTKNNEIASYVGGDVTYPLKVLSKAEIIERRISKKPYYVLNDSMLDFWFKYVDRAISLINADRGDVFYYTNVRDNIHSYMGKVFEKMAKEYLLMNVGNDWVPVLTDITDYQTSVIDENGKPRQIEIDLLGRSEKKILLIGECKFKNSEFDKADYENFIDKIKYISAVNPIICIFSLGGFSDYVKKNHGNAILINIEDMYKR
ncbi:MAG: AAA family ATPase [Pseudobutyrivibrio sp.]|nr:AAA family ATPase [Pseudobutyrivibrio sp.]